MLMMLASPKKLLLVAVQILSTTPVVAAEAGEIVVVCQMATKRATWTTLGTSAVGREAAVALVTTAAVGVQPHGPHLRHVVRLLLLPHLQRTSQAVGGFGCMALMQVLARHPHQATCPMVGMIQTLSS